MSQLPPPPLPPAAKPVSDALAFQAMKVLDLLKGQKLWDIVNEAKRQKHEEPQEDAEKEDAEAHSGGGVFELDTTLTLAELEGECSKGSDAPLHHCANDETLRLTQQNDARQPHGPPTTPPEAPKISSQIAMRLKAKAERSRNSTAFTNYYVRQQQQYVFHKEHPDEVQHDTADYNEDFYSPGMLARRAALRTHPKIIKMFYTSWRILPLLRYSHLKDDDLPPLDDENPFNYADCFYITFTVFATVSAFVFRLLVGRKPDTAKFVDLLAEDWEKEAAGHDFMTFRQFCDAMFAIVDVWCPSVDPQDYFAFYRKFILRAAEKAEHIDPNGPFDADAALRGKLAEFQDILKPKEKFPKVLYFEFESPTPFSATMINDAFSMYGKVDLVHLVGSHTASRRGFVALTAVGPCIPRDHYVTVGRTQVRIWRLMELPPHLANTLHTATAKLKSTGPLSRTAEEKHIERMRKRGQGRSVSPQAMPAGVVLAPVPVEGNEEPDLLGVKAYRPSPAESPPSSSPKPQAKVAVRQTAFQPTF